MAKAVRGAIQVGDKVTRKRDSAAGVVVARMLAVSPLARPGVFGQTVYSIRLDDAALNQASGGDQTGTGSWLRSYFKVGAR